MSKSPIKISRGLLFDVVLIVFEGTLTDFHIIGTLVKPCIHDASFASKSPFKFLEFKFFDRVYHTRNLNQKT